MPRIPLPKPEPFKSSLEEAMDTRASFSTPNAERPFSLSEIGTMFGHALGMRTEKLRHYPSGGALFPIETYVIGNAVEGHDPGVFHYHPKAHALEHLWNVPNDFDMGTILTTVGVPVGSALIVFTSVWARSGAKYGDLAYSHALIEAGHMAQNILLCTTALGIAARPLAGFRDDLINNLLDLDGVSEQSVYVIVLSPPSTQK